MFSKIILKNYFLNIIVKNIPNNPYDCTFLHKIRENMNEGILRLNKMKVEKVLKRGFDSMLMSLVSKILVKFTFCHPK